MRVVVLSTETKHHTYFLNRLQSQYEIVGILYERRRLQKSYPTGPFFVDEEDDFEDRFFDPAFEGAAAEIPESLQKRVIEVHDVNQPGVSEYISVLQPDVIITYGVGLVKPHVFEVARWGCINVHRGIAQRYRGLDSDLWAIYEENFDDIGVTIHYVDADLDTGDILAQERLRLTKDDEIFHLRYLTSVLATRLVEEVLQRIQSNNGAVTGEVQGEHGPYYTAMSLQEKRVALGRFNKRKYRLQSSC